MRKVKLLTALVALTGLVGYIALVSQSASVIESNPKDVLSKYLDASLHDRHEEAYQYISAKDKAIKSLQEYLSEGGWGSSFFCTCSRQ